MVCIHSPISCNANSYKQISFFIIVSSSNAYAQHLGGTSTFSGLVIGIPTVFSGLALLPLLKLDQGMSHFSCQVLMCNSVIMQVGTNGHCISRVELLV